MSHAGKGDGVVVDAELVSSKSQPQPLGHGWNESEQRDKEIKQHRATSPKSNSTALDKPNGDGESDIERIRFVGELRTIWEKHRGNKIHPLKITKEQGKEAFALAIAEEYGLRLFYAAWEYWVTTANLLIVTSNDKITGEDKKEFVAYPLQHFINSGEATARMKEVRPFLHLARR